MLNTLDSPQEILSHLPENLQEKWSSLVTATLENHAELNICFVGEFSVGKSRLINMLVNQDILPCALQEETALPTLIGYGEVLGMSVTDHNEQVSQLSFEVFQESIRSPSDSYRFASLNLPLDWLKSIVLVDLPGMGSNHASKREFTRAQIYTADAVVYLLSPRGLTRSDAEWLKLIHRLGKKVQVVLARWDEVLKSNEIHHEPIPNLQELSVLVEKEIGLKISVLPTSKDGHGKTELVQFLEKIGRESVDIRKERFLKESVILIHKALDILQERKKVLEVDHSSESQRLESELQSRRKQILSLKEELLKRQELDREEKESQFSDLERKTELSLEQKFSHLKNSLLDTPTSQAWEDFVRLGNEVAQETSIHIAESCQTIAEQYKVNTSFSNSEWEFLHFEMPTFPVLQKEDLLESAHLQRINAEIHRIEEMLARNNSQSSEIDPQQKQELLQQLRSLQQHRFSIAAQELPRVQQQMEGDNSGSTMGSILGNILDIALIFVPGVNVPAAALKISSHIGASGIQKFSYMKKLSCAHWGERLGSTFDKPPIVQEVIDPQALAQQQQAISQVQAEEHSVTQKLMSLQKAQEDASQTEYQRKVQLREIEHLKQEREVLAMQSVRAREELQLAQQKKVHSIMELRIKEVVRNLTYEVDQKLKGMLNLMRAQHKQYWDVLVKNTLLDYEQHLQTLMLDLQRGDLDKRDQLKNLEAHILFLENFS